ncbi:hypothetical protein E6C60_3633 [Paenibacillus algicola]|uniref:Uncharacterized protein n=1 Tax=Paenibacillus algicola TaxID=2565926 RepID=A0A4P8XPD0_9BACL|nr:hypothetical protein [Paenibacillus algicola]QCT04343.1 hypothetical protein E6C60_3633 [Paenibacillus algicola]
MAKEKITVGFASSLAEVVITWSTGNGLDVGDAAGIEGSLEGKYISV